MAGYVISPAGRQDLIDIWTEIARDNLDAAERLLDRFEAAFQRLAEFPGMGSARPDLIDLPVRFWTLGNYLIIYRAEKSPIEIVRVLNAYRNVGAMLK
jgi:toxin ParE1/3/4